MGRGWVTKNPRDPRIAELEVEMSKLDITDNVQYARWVTLNNMIYRLAHGQDLPVAAMPVQRKQVYP